MQVPNYSHRYKAKEKKRALKIQHNSTMYFIHHSLPFVSSRNATTKNGCEGDNNLLSPFLILQP